MRRAPAGTIGSAVATGLAIVAALVRLAAAATAQQPSVAMPGPILWLRADTGVVADADDRVARWQDLSGCGHDAAQPATNRQPRLVPAAVDRTRPALRFDGQDDCLICPHFDLGDYAGLTLMLVVRLAADKWCEPLAVFGNYSNPLPPGFSLRQGGFGRIMTGTSTNNLISAGGSVIGRGFILLAMDYDRRTGVYRLFENGVCVGRCGAPPPDVAPVQALTIAGQYGGYWDCLNGDIAELRVYPRALREEEWAAVTRKLDESYALTTGPADRTLARRFPFAYYPSLRQLHIAYDLDGLTIPPAAMEVAVERVDAPAPAIRRQVPLDPRGTGEALLDLPDLPDGRYRVVCAVGGQVVAPTQTFERIHFPWEGTRLGLTEQVYPPFTPVTVKGARVGVVGREYALDGLGLPASVTGLGRELLAAPVQLAVNGREGKPGEALRGTGRFTRVTPRAAVYEGQARHPAVTARTRCTIEYDGCMKVELHLQPGTKNQELRTLCLDIPLRDDAAPFMHWALGADIRNNYAGRVPRGGRIVWDVTSQVGTPPTWSASPGPSDGLVWDSTRVKDWGRYPNPPGSAATPYYVYENFVPYLWLGSVERGLAWFGENPRGYETAYQEAVQELRREGDRVVLRVHLVRRPVVLTAPRTIVFGLQASPTKPMPVDWRRRQIPSGWEAVTPWGGYYCSSKYPDNRDFTIPAQIVAGGRTGVVDRAFFEAKDRQRGRPDALVQGSRPWLESVLYFANLVAHTYNCNNKRPYPVATYFEEHATEVAYPEWQVFQDEWAPRPFNRFHANYGGQAFPPSYADFALYYANEWLTRGVGLYFDNCYLKYNAHPALSAAFRLADGAPRPAATLWQQRAYYQRLWQLIQELNARGVAPYPLEFYLHVTNAQILPVNTWSSFLLDLEQTYRMDAAGNPLPWPPDHVLAAVLARQAGSIPTVINPLRGGLLPFDFWKTASPRTSLANWGMHQVHEIFGSGTGGGSDYRLQAKYGRFLDVFGYRSPAVAVHNYWADAPAVAVDNPAVKWLALVRTEAPAGLLILQSYATNAVTAGVRFPDMKAFLDVETRERLIADAAGAVRVPLAADYGTRLLVAATRLEDVPPLAAGPGDLLYDDFECDASLRWRRLTSALTVVPDAAEPGNHVLRIGPSNLESIAPEPEHTPAAGDLDLAFRFRLPVIPTNANQTGLLRVVYRTDTQTAASVSFDVDIRTDGGQSTWAVSPLQASRGGTRVAFTNVVADQTTAYHGQGPARPALSNVSTGWHRLALNARGAHHVLRLDDTTVYEADADTGTGRGFSVGGAWSLSGPTPRVPYVEVDDVRLRRP